MRITNDYEQTYTTKELAIILKVTRPRVRQIIYEKLPDLTRKGRDWLIKKSQIEQLKSRRAWVRKQDK